jgi:predicted  nucleic acid-binding Zn-ribbon protein
MAKLRKDFDAMIAQLRVKLASEKEAILAAKDSDILALQMLLNGLHASNTALEASIGNKCPNLTPLLSAVLQDLASVEAKLKIVDELDSIDNEIRKLTLSIDTVEATLRRDQKNVDDLTDDINQLRKAIAELQAKLSCLGPSNTPADVEEHLKRYNELINTLLSSSFKRKATIDPEESGNYQKIDKIEDITSKITDEYIEITNISNKTLDLAGWHIADNKDMSTFEFRLSTEIAPGQSVKVWHAHSKFRDSKTDFVWATRSSAWSWNDEFTIYYWVRHSRNFHEGKNLVFDASVNRPSVSSSFYTVEAESVQTTTSTSSSTTTVSSAFTASSAGSTSSSRSGSISSS